MVVNTRHGEGEDRRGKINNKKKSKKRKAEVEITLGRKVSKQGKENIEINQEVSKKPDIQKKSEGNKTDVNETVDRKIGIESAVPKAQEEVLASKDLSAVGTESKDRDEVLDLKDVAESKDQDEVLDLKDVAESKDQDEVLDLKDVAESEDEHEVSETDATFKDVSDTGMVIPQDVEEFDAFGLDEESQAVVDKIRSEQMLVFNKAEALKDIESCGGGSESTILKPREKSLAEELFMELKSIRTTDVEFLLEDTRRISKLRDAKQTQIIEQLDAQVKTLQQKVANATSGKSQLEKTNAELMEKNAKLGADLARFLEHELSGEIFKDSKASHVKIETQMTDLELKLEIYTRLTGLKVDIEDDVVNCTLLNKVLRKAVKYQVDFTEHEEGSISFRPTGNLNMFPEFLKEEIVTDRKSLPVLQAHITKALFCDASN